MATCANYSEQLLDFLYDLLDDEASAQLRLHLRSCPHCQAELSVAEGQQRLLGQAARACTDVAIFTAPDQDMPAAEPSILPISSPAAATSPQHARPAVAAAPRQTVPGGKQRFPGWLRYGSVALAASLLLGVVFAREAFRSGLERRQSEVAQIKKEVAGLEAQFTQASHKYEERQQEIAKPSDARQVVLTGTREFDASAGAWMSVQTNDLKGNLQDANLEVEITDAATNEVIYKDRQFCQGDNARIKLPPGLKSKEMRVTVNCQTLAASPAAVVNLHAADPVFVSQLAVNKSAYYVRELLFFRSVTLEQFSLKPIAKGVPVRFSLVNADGQVVKQMQGKTEAGGVAGGEFALTDDIPAGNYFVEVAAATDAGIVPQKRRVEILTANSLQVVMDKQVYHPGDVIQPRLVGPNAQPIVDQRVIQDIAPPGAAQAATPANQYRTYTDSKGNFRGQVPHNLDAAKATLNVAVPTRTNYENVRTTINIVPAKVMVDFFPEGGDLIDGIPTKVYYRVRSLQGEAVVPEGRIIVETAAGRVLHESEPGKAIGVFSLTPSIQEKYHVRLKSSRSEVVNASPFATLGIRAQGVVLSVPQGVTAANEAIQATVTTRGAAKRLLVLATCRGQIVDQQTLFTRDGDAKLELKLSPSADVAGVFRVTVYEVKGQGMTPLAERLVFRMPGHRLELQALAAGSLGLRQGRNKLQGKWVDENKRLVEGNIYGGCSVVESQFAGEGERDPGTQFYLDNDVASPAELENSTILVRDDQASQKALDLFLGTQGWRRFVAEVGLEHLQLAARGDKVKEAAGKNNTVRPSDDAPKSAEAKNGALESRTEQALANRDRERTETAAPVLLTVQNAGLSELQAADQVRMNRSAKGLFSQFAAQTATLASEKEALVKEYERRFESLTSYERLPREYLANILSLATLLSVAVGVLLLLFGFIRLMCRKLATPAFAGCFGSLALCIVCILAGKQMRPDELAVPRLAELKLPEWPALAEADVKAHWPAASNKRALAPGEHVLLAAAPESERSAIRRGGNGGIAQKQLQDGLTTMRQTETLTRLNSNMVAAAPGPQSMGATRRFDVAMERQKAGAPGQPRPAPAGGGGPGTNDGKKADLDAAPFYLGGIAREFAYSANNPQDRSDLMLWYPATILWSPAQRWDNNATVQLNFDLPETPQPTSYRVLIQAHTDDGRLGYFEKTMTPATAQGR